MMNWMNKNGSCLSNKEQTRVDLFWRVVLFFKPKLSRPRKLVVALSNFFPESCPFERTVRLNGTLIVFIPALCQFNPYYEAIMDYRMEEVDDMPNFFN